MSGSSAAARVTEESVPLSEQEHRAQLRRAVIASTIGTTIEWYDFFLYSTVTGLVFAKLYFPRSDPLVGTLEAFAIYAVGFAARPIGAAIFGHWGDRLGRKSALIATLMLMGIATFLVGLVPTYASIGIWGAVLLTRAALHPGDRRRRRVGRLGAAVDGVGAHQSPSGLRRILAAVRRAVGAVPRQSRRAGIQLAVRRCVRHLGLAGAVPDQHRAGRDRSVDPSRHSGDANLPTPGRREPDRACTGRRGVPTAGEGDVPQRIRADGGAGTILHLHRVRVRLWCRNLEGVTRSAAGVGAGGLGGVVLLDPDRRPSVGQVRTPSECISSAPSSPVCSAGSTSRCSIR